MMDGMTDKDVKQLNKVTDGVYELFSRTITSDLINGEYIMARGDGNTYLLGIPGHCDQPDSTPLITDEGVSSLFAGDTLRWFVSDAKSLRKALRGVKDEGKLKLRTHLAQDYTDNVLFESYDSGSYVQATEMIAQTGVPAIVLYAFEIGINKRQWANALAALEGPVTAYIVLKTYLHLTPSFAVILVEQERKRFAILMGKHGDHTQFSMYSKGVWECETRSLLKSVGDVFAKVVNLDSYWNTHYTPYAAAQEITQKYDAQRTAMIARIQERDPYVALEYNGEDFLVAINSTDFKLVSLKSRMRLVDLMQTCGYELRDSGNEKIQMGSGYYARMVNRFSVFKRKED
jgi:hypothetical protein